jgi:pimeloyl-ACP methyl ester carboxylesterase
MNDWWQQQFPAGRQTLTIRDASDRPVTIAYGEVGSGPPLLLLHGLGSWSYNWRRNIHPLSRHFRVICVDAKGYGFSSAAPLPETVGHQVIELGRMIAALSDTPVCVAAESMGALTTLALAQSQPDLLDRLVVINVPIFPQQLPSWGMRSLSYLPLDWVQWLDQGQLLRPFAPVVQELTRWVRQEVVVDPNSITDDELYWLTYPYLYRRGPLTQFTADLQLATQEIERSLRQQPSFLGSVQQNLPRITHPTQILWSDRDRWFPASDGEKLRDRLPNAHLQLIPNCGHVASSASPDLVNAAIIAHCRGYGAVSS